MPSAPPAGSAALAAGGGVGAGVGAWIGHLWNTILKEEIHAIGDLLDDGESAIVVVTVNPKQTDVVPLLEHPEKYKVIQTKAGTWTRSPRGQSSRPRGKAGADAAQAPSQ